MLAAPVLALLAGARQVLDGTLGGGGHALALLETRRAGDGPRPRPGGDRRRARAARALRRRAAPSAPCRGTSPTPRRSTPPGRGPFDGVLLDLGVSSHQLDDAGARLLLPRGRAPRHADGRGRRRHRRANGSTSTDERELARVFREYADEPHAGRLAREIVRRRATRGFATADDLVGAIRGAFGPRTGAPEFARLFQAVRIAVNDELAGIARALPRLRDRLAPGGTLVVISYHSGEDRIVKHAFREWSAACVCPPKYPVCTCRGRPLGTTLTRKAVTADALEIASNPRARSARLRAWRSDG